MRKLFIAVLLFAINHIANGQSTNELRYWFDDDSICRATEVMQGNSWKGEIDVSEMDATIHTLYIQVIDSSKVASPTQVQHFIKMPTLNDITMYSYWFDNDTTEIKNHSYTNGIIPLDVASLEEGFHTLHITTGKKGVSPVETRHFIKIPQTIGAEYLTSIAFINDELYMQEKINAPEGIIKWDIDITNLPQGIHLLQLRVSTPTGAVTEAGEYFFVRSATEKEISGLKCFYTLDNNGLYEESGRYDENTFNFNLDVSSLSNGVHNVCYMLTDENGTVSNIRSAYFIKVPTGDYGITKYEYWINDNENGKIRTVLKNPENPLQLLEDLPVESYPIRASSFHFEAIGATPVIYAKNVFNIRFFNDEGNYTEYRTEYIDSNEWQAVENTMRIEDGTQETIAKLPATDEIRWFCAAVTEGDSICLKSDVECTLQIFSPTGEEVYSASGNNSTEYGNCLAEENGIYYIALHSVSDESKEDVTLSSYITISENTGIENIPHCDKKEYIIYDISGNRIDKIERSGIYIINNKKVFIRCK